MRFSATYRTLFLFLLCLLIGLAVSSARAQAILYVQPGATGDCSSWAAACDLQDALAVAANGDEVWVAEGTYTPTDGTDRGISFELVNGVALYGGFAGTEAARDERDWRAHETILSGDIGAVGDSLDNSYHVLYAHSGDSTTVLDGFTVIDGNANSDSVIRHRSGGGLTCVAGAGTSCNLTIRHSIFARNSALFGGAISTDGDCSLTIRNAWFRFNVSYDNGGAIFNLGDLSVTIINALFTNNSVLYGSGGAITSFSNTTNSLALTNVTFADNTADGSGGAINYSTNDAGALMLTNVILWGNETPYDVWDQISFFGVAPVLRHTLVEGGCEADWDCGDGSTILTADPVFVNPADSDYRLRSYSNALNAGDNAALPAGLTTDLAGNPRIFQNADPALRVVDLGAYEFQGEPAPCPPGTAVYVDRDAAGTNDGTSWADAFTRLQDGLALARAGSCTGVAEVWVAEGTYTPTDGTDRMASFELVSGVALYGGFTGTEAARDQRDWRAHETILSGDIGTVGDSLDNSYHVLYAENVDSTAVLDGFTITGGQADDGSTVANRRGGGFYCIIREAGDICNPTIRHSVFTRNRAQYGGALFNGGSDENEENESSPTLTNVTFAGNSALYSGGAIYNDGSDNGASDPTLTNVLFIGNSATYGGAIYNDGLGGASSPVLINVLFAGNSATFGGAIYSDGSNGGVSSPTLTNVTFASNSAIVAGGAMSNDGTGGGASSPVLTNVILWGNTAPQGPEIANDAATPVLRHTLIEGGCAGILETNGSSTDCGDGSTILDADPLFADPANSDYRLKGSAPGREASPAIDAGDNTALPTDVTTDLAGEARVTAVMGTEAIIDLGTYESTGTPLPVELAAFTASVEGQAVVLSWKTLSEKGNDGFAVEWRNGRTKEWKQVGFVEGRGTPSGGHAYEYRVEGLDYGTYRFRLKQEDLDGTTETLGEVEAVVGLAAPYVISEVYPNPSRGRATVEVAVREAQHVRVEVYDVLGRRVAVLFDKQMSANATRRVRLDGSRFASGVYFVRIVGEDFAEVRKVTLVR